LLILVGNSEITVTKLQYNTIAIKQKELFLTNDVWKIVASFESSSYEGAIRKLRDDLKHIRGVNNIFAPIYELHQVERLLEKLEHDVNVFKEMFPRIDSRRAILNVVGAVFKFLFGTATVMDYENLHRQVHELHQKDEDIVHSVNYQLTYLKNLDTSVKFNTKAVGILSEKVRAVISNTKNWRDHTDLTIHWLNATFYNQLMCLHTYAN
jgi:hypothetical protein